jgi:uncharacterized membrane-anchored protein YhcB (DUF1043 family)
MGILAATISTPTATTAWVPFLIGLIVGLVIGIWLHRR